MPRTKVVKKRRVTNEHSNSTYSDIVEDKKPKDISVQIEEVREQIQHKLNCWKHNHMNHLKKIKEFYGVLNIQICSKHLDQKVISELKTSNTEVNPQFSKPKSQRTVRKRSNSCSTRTTAHKSGGSRSASCDRNAPHSASKFRTPLSRNIPTMPVVTPKVNPNIPLSVLRRPRQGEFAMSMSGSPLMVSSVTYDEMASVSVPLPDGRVLSILPTEGISAANLRLDDETRKQLIKLRSNLSKCLGKS